MGYKGAGSARRYFVPDRDKDLSGAVFGSVRPGWVWRVVGWRGVGPEGWVCLFEENELFFFVSFVSERVLG